MMIQFEDILFVDSRVCLYSIQINLFRQNLVLASVTNEENTFIYRLETDNQSRNLTGVTNFCYELGGYPIYANNAYEWQLIQG